MFFFNECSIEKQFHHISDFSHAFDQLMLIRKSIEAQEEKLLCHSNVGNRSVNETCNVWKALGQHLNKDKAKAARKWLDKAFWDESGDRHSEDEYLECKGDVVTDTSIGAAAFQIFHNTEDARLVSLQPSSWQEEDITVSWHENDNEEQRQICLKNYISLEGVSNALQGMQPPDKSWGDLKKRCERDFTKLFFSKNSFDPMQPISFRDSTRDRIWDRLNVLNAIENCYDAQGKLSEEGIKLHERHFHGGTEFSDSSDTEKNVFEKKLTFSHPERDGEVIFCPMHGKLEGSGLPIRIHYYKDQTTQKLYVVYIGQKLTKK